MAEKKEIRTMTKTKTVSAEKDLKPASKEKKSKPVSAEKDLKPASKEKKSKPYLLENNNVINARMDHAIIEALKKKKSGLCINELNNVVIKEPDMEEANWRKRIKSRLEYLREFGDRTGLFDIRSKNEYEENKQGQKEVFCYSAKISNPEIQLMLRSFSAIRGKPVDKLQDTDPKTGKYKAVRNSRRFFANYATEKFIRMFEGEEPSQPRNEKMMENISIIMSAIINKRALRVSYGDYHIDKKLWPRKDKDGNDTFIIYPIKMAVSMSRYYLYCQYKNPPAKTDDDKRVLYTMRVDRIISCEELDEKTEKYKLDDEVKRVFNGTGEPHYAQRLYMYTGSASCITFLTDKKHLNDVFDWFGDDKVTLSGEGDKITVTVWADQNAMLYWALQYCRYVKVTSPKTLVDKIKETLGEALESYGGIGRQAE